MKFLKTYEELIFNSEKTGKNIEDSSFSNRLLYWNGLYKKFINNKLTDSEKKDYKDLCSARTTWLLMDLDESSIDVAKKSEYKKRLKDFEESFERVNKLIPDNFKELEKNLKKREDNFHLVESSEATRKSNNIVRNQSSDNMEIRKFRSKSIEKDSKLMSKDEALKKSIEITKRYNDWLESVDIPWSEISSYLDKKEVIKANTNSYFKKFLNSVLNVFDYALNFTKEDDIDFMKKSDYDEAKSEFGRFKNDAEVLIKQYEEALGKSYYDVDDDIRNKIIKIIKDLKQAINKKDLNQVKKLTIELEESDKDKKNKSNIKFKR